MNNVRVVSSLLHLFSSVVTGSVGAIQLANENYVGATIFGVVFTANAAAALHNINKSVDPSDENEEPEDNVVYAELVEQQDQTSSHEQSNNPYQSPGF